MRDLNKANELFQQLHDKDILEDDPDLQEIMKNYIYGDVYQHGDIDLKLRELILIVVNTTNHTLSSLQEHVIAALYANVLPVQIKEAIYQCTPYIGLGKVQDAIDIVNQVFKDQHIDTIPSQSTVNENTRFEKGFNVQSTAFQRVHIQANHDNAPQELKHIQNYLSEYCFGDFYTRNGLDIQMRELMTMVMLATLGGCESQLKAHVGANIRVGNSRQLLIDTITQCIPYIGFPRTLNAIQMINEVTKED